MVEEFVVFDVLVVDGESDDVVFIVGGEVVVCEVCDVVGVEEN